MASVPVVFSSALAAAFSLQDARAYESEPYRTATAVRKSANHALKYVRKQFTTATGLPLAIEVDLTAEECFVCPPFKKTGPEGKGQEGVIDIESDTPDSFKWKEFLARAFQPDQLKDVLSSPVYRVTLQNTGVTATRYFMLGSQRGCSDAKNWEWWFWRTDQKVVRCTVNLDGKKPPKYTTDGYEVGVRHGPGPAQGGQRFVGSEEVRQSGTAFLYGGMEDANFLSYLQRRVQDRDGFNIKVLVLPYEDSLPERVKILCQRLRELLPSDFQSGLPAAADPTQSALAANEGTQVAPAAGEHTQLAAGEPTQPAPAANDGTQDVPAIGVTPQNRDYVTAWGGWSQREWDEWEESQQEWWSSRRERGAFASDTRGRSWTLQNEEWILNTPGRNPQDQSDDRWSRQDWGNWWSQRRRRQEREDRLSRQQ